MAALRNPVNIILRPLIIWIEEEFLMLLTGYRKEIFRPECNPSFQSLHCVAYLDEDIEAVLPYLNARLGGDEYYQEPPAVTFRPQGKLITVHPKKIAVNALRDEEEAEKILEWLKREINEAWEKREETAPSTESAPKPKLLDILKLLPKTNCKLCGEPTCMVFAAKVTEGIKGPEDCPSLSEDLRIRLADYLPPFNILE
jgi:ArsR family metal-binding transcriptional regulator